ITRFPNIGLFVQTRLSPFAQPSWLLVGPAFPAADYYGDSVALRLAPGRPSRIPGLVDVQDSLGALFVPLRLLEAVQRPRSAFPVVISWNSRSWSRQVATVFPDPMGCSVGTGVQTIRLHLAIRVSTSGPRDGWAAPGPRGHAPFPFGF